ncbi:CDGSH iron-sulfur domain-containing protein 3, mitochondrial isoform X1 [Macrotis lagotis]|uniref:CDGSH iron-sulfur domain-containing protein 3, mitochondrial isoform X1 n=1 Tax=Macrotis lagotis TaxID=92651 RepID=UPI003D68E2C9
MAGALARLRGLGSGTRSPSLQNLELRWNQTRLFSSWLEKWFPRKKPLIAQKKPIKVSLKAGKTYKWCICGRSKNQPYCDGSHLFQGTGLFPLRFKVKEDCSAVLCTCKATLNPPYCDGTHKSERIQKAQEGSPL